MARKPKKKERSLDTGSVSFFSVISRETFNTILGVFAFVISIFLLLGAFGASGRVGTLTYEFFSNLFGIGYYLMPLVFLLLSISFIHERERDFAEPQIIGSVLFFISSLGLVDLFSESGGVVGNIISKPLISLFDIYISAIMLVAFIIISILIIFDINLKVNIIEFIKHLFFKDKDEEMESSANEESVIEMAVERNNVQETITNKQEVSPRSLDTRSKKQDAENDGFTPLMIRRSGKLWAPPPLSLLEGDRGKAAVGDIKANANLIKRTLLNFGIVVEMDEISIGPSVTRYAMKPAEGVKLSKILGLQTNLELALAAHPVRIEAPIPGKSLVGIEVPNTSKSTVGVGSIVSDPIYTQSDKPLLVGLGRDIAGQAHFANIAKMPHCLIAGATGSGKSVTIHALITSLLYRNPPENLKFIMIDPKRVELTAYNGIPHLLTPVITDPKKSIMALKWLAKEMDRRYDVLEKNSARDIESYHKNILQPALEKGDETDTESMPDSMPYIVVIIDELADLMQTYPRELEAAIVRLAQMSRAVGIHLILSTQRPSVNVITGLIKANIPARVALQVASQIDSRTILDAAGAEKLLGAGDMLFLGAEMGKPVRIQSAFISEKEVKSVAKHLKDAYADELQDEINFSESVRGTDSAGANSIFSSAIDEDSFEGDDDELYEEARETVVQAGKASTSFLQRKLRIGYARAARLMDMLEERGVIGAGSGAKPREVLNSAPRFPEGDESNFDNTPPQSNELLTPEHDRNDGDEN
jgi:DNA segregation ATPase FtsK/SpoIIIE, S-DNA-T family